MGENKSLTLGSTADLAIASGIEPGALWLPCVTVIMRQDVVNREPAILGVLEHGSIRGVR